MADRYYSNADEGQRFQPGTRAESGQVDQKFDEVTTGFQAVAVDTDRSLKLPSVADTSQELDATPLQRRRKVVGFDADGNLALLQGFSWRGNWATATEYFVNDVFRDPATKNLYVTQKKHTSDTIANDVTAGNIKLAINVEDVEIAKAAAIAARDKAKQWAEEPTDTEVETGAYSAKHHAAKSSASASASSSSASASATARDKSQQWADEAVDTEVEAGKYSAKHHAAKASGSASESASSASAAASIYDAFDDRYLGSKSSDPTADNDGNSLLEGALYWNATAKQMRVFDGTNWMIAYLPDASYVSGPAASVDDNVALFEGGTGKIIKDTKERLARALTQSLVAPPSVRDVDAWDIDASAVSRHSGGSIASFEVAWWDGVTESVAASSGAATLSRAVDQPVGGTVSATVRAFDDIGNTSARETVTADVVANSAPEGPISISAPTQVGKNSTFQVSFSGATDADGDPITYTVTDTSTFTFAKTSGILEGELVDVTAPGVTSDTDVTFSVVAEDDVGAQSATYSATVTVLAAQVIGVEITSTGGPGGTWNHIDEAGAAITSPTASWFNGHPVFGGMVDVTVDGQDMVEVPKFYYKRGTSSAGNPAWWISDQPLTGYTVMPAFVLDGVEVSSFQYGKYQASLSGDKLQSVPGVTPTVSRTLTQFLADAEARNVSGVAGFRLHHYDMWLAIQWLYLVENATMDSQTKTGEGHVNGSAALNVDDATVAQATYRGIVGLWGNVYQWMDGARTLNSVIQRRGYNGAWQSTGESVPNAGSTTYPITFRNSAPLEFIPDTYSTSNDNTATVPDYVRWRNSGEYYPYVGGDWSGGANAGLWCVSCSNSASVSYSGIGARLARVVS